MRRHDRLARLAGPALAVVSLSVAICERAEAIPAFARRFNTTCFTCHTTEPLLNEFGLRFQAAGYRLPGTHENTPIWDQTTLPFAVVVGPAVSHAVDRDNLAGTSTVANSFSGIELGLFSTASLGSHFVFFAESPIAISAGTTQITIEDAHLIYADVLGNGLGELNFRLGKFRLFIPYIPNVILGNSDPLALVYGYNPLEGKTANELLFAEPTFGASAFGILPQVLDGLRWELAVTGGTNSDIDWDAAHAVFASLNQTVFLDNAPLRFGAFIFGGTQNVADTTVAAAPWNNALTRIGVHAEITDPVTKRVTLFGQYVTARDDNPDNRHGAMEMNGGFLGATVTLVPETFYAFGRYDVMTITQTNEKQNQIDLGLHYHILPNALVTAGFTTLTRTVPGTVDHTVTTISAGTLLGF